MLRPSQSTESDQQTRLLACMGNDEEALHHDGNQGLRAYVDVAAVQLYTRKKTLRKE